MSSSVRSLSRPRRRVSVVSAIIALAALIGGVASNLVANDIQAKLGPYGRWAVWAIFIVASIVAIAAALLGTDSSKIPPSESPGSESSNNPGATAVNITASRGVGAGEIKDSVITTGDQNVTIHQSQVHGSVIGRQETHYHQQIIQPPPAINALHQLPPPSQDFTGREKELNELLDAHEQGGYLITGVQGLGGVGKTALALKLAERLKPHFPDAQFYLDLRGASPQPIPVTEALAQIIRAYHPDAKLPDDVASLQTLYRSVLDEQRALVLMDNAADRAQVEPLIPPASCLLLVTSRQHFTLPGLFRQNLESMPPAEARELLLKVTPRIGNQADEIARLCGHLPLALRVAASLLAENCDLSVDDYARRLGDERQRLELLRREDQSVAASLGLSYELLGEELRGLWRALAVFPATFELSGASAVWELERDSAQTVLSKLVRYSLVDWIEQTARYRLHDLARLFAGRLLSDDERAAVRQRHAAHYCRVLAEANGLYRRGGAAIKRGLDMFDAEWSNIQAGQGWAAEHAETNSDVALLYIEYSDAGAEVLSLRQHPRERIRRLETTLTISRRLKRRFYEGATLGRLGLAYYDLGDYHRAIDFHEQALAVTREVGDRFFEGRTLGNLGMAYRSLDNYRRAIDFHEQALAITREIGDRFFEGRTLNNLGGAYYYPGDYHRAIDLYEQALAITRKTGDRSGEGYALNNLGIAYNSLGDYHRAIDFHEQRLAVAREIGDRHGEGYALENLSLCLDQLGQRVEAIAQAEEALQIFEGIEPPRANKVRQKLAEWRKQT